MRRGDFWMNAVLLAMLVIGLAVMTYILTR